jgi:hypothetical protein
MIDHLDRMIRQMLLDSINPGLTIGFEPPDEEWRTKAVPPDGNALNVYLIELRENRRLRTNDRTQTLVDGDVQEQPAPRRIDCHYLISAWSPALVSPTIEPTLDEHALLHRVASAFANREPLIAHQIFASVPLPPGFPPNLVDQALPTTLLPQESYAKLPEFWGTMGEKQALKPVVHVVVTVPLELDSYRAGPMVTTRVLTFRFTGDPSPGETLFEFGGFVLDSTAPLPDGSPSLLPDIWVELLDTGGARLQLTRSTVQGRFTFSNLVRGDYQLRAAAPGFPVLTRAVSVPSPTGEYALTFA